MRTGKVIAVAGKGGTGKTAIAALLIRELLNAHADDADVCILAVDADADSNLPDALGVAYDKTLGDIREGLLEEKQRDITLDLRSNFEGKIAAIIVEEARYDLLVMGRPEGPGCYCAVNHILRNYLESLRSSYRFTVLDNEAGLEHLSRRVTHGIDVLLVISDANPIALRAAGRIARMADALELNIKDRCLILNSVRNGLSPRAKEEAKRTELETVGTIPFDPEVEKMNLSGCSVHELPEKAVSVQKVSGILDKLLQKEESA